MKLTRSSRLITACIMLFSLLFMQYATAAYACPDLMPAMNHAATTQPSKMAQQDMTGCTGKDAAQPSLCHAHDQSGNQSLDKPGTPMVHAFVPASLVTTVSDVPDSRGLAPARIQSVVLARSTAPPLSIRNCCFRI